MIVTYFIQSVYGGPIKIGRSSASGVRSRLGSLQTGNPQPLVVTRVIEGDQEKALHLRFNQFRLAGEWFLPVAELAELADAVAGEARDDPRTTAEYQLGYDHGWAASVSRTSQGMTDAAFQAVKAALLGERDSLLADAEFDAKEARKFALIPPTMSAHVERKAA